MGSESKIALSVPEAAELLGVSVPLVYELVGRDDFPALKIGRRTLINRKLLSEWLDKEAGGSDER